MENYFKRLNTIQGEVSQKKNLSYISWADAWEIAKKEFPDANYTIYENEKGFPFWSSNYGIDVKVGVTINEIEHIVRLPVMDGANKAMKNEAYNYKTKYGEKTCEAATQFDINKAIQRALTKALAMHGIGLYVYRGEDLPDQLPDFTEEDFKRLQGSEKKTTLETIKKYYEVSKEWEKKIKNIL